MKYTKISKRWKNDLHIQKPQDLEVATYNFFAFLSSWLLSLGIFINNIQSFGFPSGTKQIYYDFLFFCTGMGEYYVFSQKSKRLLEAILNHGESLFLFFFCPNRNRLGSFSFRQKLFDGSHGTFP